jgi:membrane-associated phospholipid phosphatase
MALRKLVWLTLLFAFLPCASAAAQPEIAELHYDLQVDAPIVGVAGVWLLASELAKPDLAADQCRWCDRHADGRDALNVLDSSARMALRWHDPQLANVLSHISAYGIAPVAVFGTLALAQSHDEALGALPVDLLIIAQAVFVSQALNQALKFATGRERPFVHSLSEADKPLTAQPSDNNTSFYSGHTSLTFSLAVAAGTVASMRGYRWASWVWVVGLTIASLTGYLRIAADRHYLSDVLTGATLGSAIGFALPYTLHSRKLPRLSMTSLPHGFMFSLSWMD